MTVSLVISSISREKTEHEKELGELGKKFSQITRTIKGLWNGKIMANQINGSLTIHDAIAHLGLDKVIARKEELKTAIANIENKKTLTGLLADSIKSFCNIPLKFIADYVM